MGDPRKNIRLMIVWIMEQPKTSGTKLRRGIGLNILTIPKCH